jgi:hypothetical protein
LIVGTAATEKRYGRPQEHWTLNACVQRALDGTRPAPEED